MIRVILSAWSHVGACYEHSRVPGMWFDISSRRYVFSGAGNSAVVPTSEVSIAGCSIREKLDWIRIEKLRSTSPRSRDKDSIM
jgi:hypothetical protein